MIWGSYKRRLQRFRTRKRGYWSFLFLMSLLFLSLFGELLCNDRPLFVHYQSKFYVPFLMNYSGVDFGEDYETEASYSEEFFLNKDAFVLWAPIRFGAQSIDLKLTQAAPTVPDSRHLLGTDDRGRDVFARLIFGFRLSLFFGLLLASIGALLGFFVGALQAYEASKLDSLGQRFIEVWSSLPELFVLMILTSLFRPSFLLLLVFMSSMAWIGFAAYVRAEVLRIRNTDFILSAQALGASKFHIMIHHVLPHALAPVLTYFPIRVSIAITSLASLDFLGLGLPHTNPSLGELLFQGKAHLSCWWIFLSSFCLLSLSLVMLQFISEGLREAFDTQ